MTLESLAAKYGTDKLDHGYMPFYEKHLPKEPKRILEIGVKSGASLKMWREYFPFSEIHGLDLFEENDMGDVIGNILSECPIESMSMQSVFLHKGNQCDYLLLEQLRTLDFDVIIDDGSHNSRDQMMTFFGLFNGKHYFIEDLHCNDDPFFSQGLPAEFNVSNLFSDVAIANGGTIYKDCIQFNDDLVSDPRKIVCIKNII